MKNLVKFSRQPELKSPSLIVGWTADASKLGTKITDYLNKKLGGESFCAVEPIEFFPMGGVTIEDDLVQFPESEFYACPEHDLLVFKSTPPSYEWYRFLNLIMDVAEQYRVKEIYTVGGMVSLSAHTTPRQILGTFNSPQFKSALSAYGLNTEWDYETPPGQRPTLNSFLLWAASRRNIPGTSLWVPIPFYLADVDDPKAEGKLIEFFNQRFNLQMDMGDIDEAIRQQNQIIAEARQNLPDIDKAIKRLESNLRLSDEESQELVKEIERFLKEKKG